MKKVVITIIIFIIIIFISLFYIIALTAKEEIIKEESIIDIQNDLQTNFKSYGYTLDNPNIILNPYEISPLSALIIFETKDSQEVSIEILDKDNNPSYKNTFTKSTIHYIPIYGLYPDYNNKIIIKCNNEIKEYYIKTDKLPDDLINKETNTSDKLLFITNDKYTYAIDNNNQIRWYLTKNYTGKISRLSNGNILLSTDKIIYDNLRTGLVEIDLLGKVLKEYIIDEGYNHSYYELDSSILVLSNNLLKIDKQTTKIIDTIELEDIYNKIEYKDNNIILKNNTKTTYIDEDKNISSIEEDNLIDDNEYYTNLYINNNNYIINKGYVYSYKQKTKTISKNILLLNYKKVDSTYNSYNIEYLNYLDRLYIKGEFNSKDEVYIILNKLTSKKVYKLDTSNNIISYKCINKDTLKGKYSIYIKINDIVYKTNKYIII